LNGVEFAVESGANGPTLVTVNRLQFAEISTIPEPRAAATLAGTAALAGALAWRRRKR